MPVFTLHCLIEAAEVASGQSNFADTPIVQESQLFPRSTETLLDSSHPLILYLIASVTLAVGVLVVVAFALSISNNDNVDKNDRELLEREFQDAEELMAELESDDEHQAAGNEGTTQRRGKGKGKSQSSTQLKYRKPSTCVSPRKRQSVQAPIQLTQSGSPTSPRSKKRSSQGQTRPVSTSSLNVDECVSENPLLYRQLKGHNGNLTSCYYSRDSQFIVSASEDGSVRIWFIQHTLQYDANSFINQQILAQLSPLSQQHTLNQLNTDTNTTVQSLRINMKDKTMCRCVVMSEDSNRFICGMVNGEIHVYSVKQRIDKKNETGHVQLKVELETNWQTEFNSESMPLSQLLIDPYSAFVIALSHSSESHLYVYDFKGHLLQTLNSHQLINTQADLSRDGTLMVVATKASDCKVFAVRRVKGSKDMKLDRIEQITALKGHKQQVNGVSIASDNSCIVTGSNDGCIRCFDLLFDERSKHYDTKQRYMIETAAPIQRVAICPIVDNQIITVSSQSLVYLCRLADGELLAEFHSSTADHSHSLDFIHYSGDGTMQIFMSRNQRFASVVYTPSIDVEAVEESDLEFIEAPDGEEEKQPEQQLTPEQLSQCNHSKSVQNLVSPVSSNKKDKTVQLPQSGGAAGVADSSNNAKANK